MPALQGESICILTLHIYVQIIFAEFARVCPAGACDPSSVGREILKLVPVQYNPRGVANTVPWHFYSPIETARSAQSRQQLCA